MDVIHLTLIIALVADDVFPKTLVPNAPFPSTNAGLKVFPLWEFRRQIVL